MPIKDKYISENDCYLGKVNVEYKYTEDTDTIFNDQNYQQYYKDKSKIADKTLNGKIDKVIRYEKKGMDHMKIRLRKFRIPELGDKMVSAVTDRRECVE